MITRWARAIEAINGGLTTPFEVRRVLGSQSAAGARATGKS
jgi:hypothetical protein